MGSKLCKSFGVLMFVLISGLALAQDYRGEIILINDWDDTAHVTMLMERHDEMIRTRWTIEAGQRIYLSRAAGGPRIRVSARDRIKVSDDSRPVAIGDVGRFRDGAWHVRVRDAYRAQRGRDGYQREEYAERIILKIHNIAAVYSGPRSRTTFSVDRPTRITKIWTYHWNDGRGAEPGTISLRNLDTRQKFGPFDATGRDGVDSNLGADWSRAPIGASGLYWTVEPEVDVPAGRYEVLDSDPGTWSTNSEMGDRGCAWVYGR